MIWIMSRYLHSSKTVALTRAWYISIASVALGINFLIFDHVRADTQVNQIKQGLINEAETLIRQRLDQLFKKYSEKKDDPKISERIKYLGFDQVSDLTNAKAGSPFKVYMIRLDELQSYQTGSDPRPLLHETNGRIFPLMLNEQVRSSAMVDLSRKDQGDEFILRVTQLGSPSLIKVLTEFRQVLEQKKGCESTCFVVWVPAIKRYFLGDKTSEGIKLKVLIDGPGEKLKKGDFLPAEQVFSILQSEAQKNQRYEFPPHDPRFPVR
jgi:hypothetical protein